MPPAEKGGQPTQCGNKTECALLGFVQDIGRDYESVRKANPEESFFKVTSSILKNEPDFERHSNDLNRRGSLSFSTFI